ncbi:hypothetical protein BDQ12DRAFT_750947 [Crucibulum laeve]|uniref:Uncharacterized protein n=1 Tax=Crucibulum laeve TaxID=68775 RepID=A0A5C3LW32_9AGAR|nr:hypothetical protein BDQ12DRAFT_750947 [Crucibulum laeve]
MTTYSAFFSSGLLAPHHAFNSKSLMNLTQRPDYASYDSSPMKSFDSSPMKGFDSSPIRDSTPMKTDYYAPSPARASSPMPIPDDSDIEIDDDDEEEDKQGTPTRRASTSASSVTSTTSVATAASLSSQTHTSASSNATNQPRPRLRKRRSSLTVAASPMAAIRSPVRTAGNAGQLQRHLTPLRARSGSVGADVFGSFSSIAGGNGNVATQGTSLMSRMRSGSIGGASGMPAAGVGASFRPRRGVRRINSVPAAAPPPTAPLPPVPSSASHAIRPSISHLQPVTGAHPPPLRSAPLYTGSFANKPTEIFTNAANQAMKGGNGNGWTLKGRERAFSASSVYSIDEEMKEN